MLKKKTKFLSSEYSVLNTHSRGYTTTYPFNPDGQNDGDLYLSNLAGIAVSFLISQEILRSTSSVNKL